MYTDADFLSRDLFTNTKFHRPLFRSVAIILIVGFLSATVIVLDSTAGTPSESPIPFASEKKQIPGVNGATSVQVGDINGDGLNDVAVFEGGKHADGRKVFAWFEAPNWIQHDFDREPPGPFLGHSAMVDIDGDGLLDIVVSEDDHSRGKLTGRLFWWRNPGGGSTGQWVRTKIAEFTNTQHIGGLNVADMDNDGKLDVILRHLGVQQVRICFQNSSDDWTVRSFPVRHREGIQVGDLDNDGIVDIILNGFWWAGPADWRTGQYTEYVIDDVYYTQLKEGLNNSTKAGIGDIDGDGKVDVVFSVAEGEKAFLAWYRAPESPRSQSWKRYIIEDNFTGGHQVILEDFDLDGDLDIATGLSFGKTGVFIWRNNGNGTSFVKETLATTVGMYYGVGADIGNDGDIDLIGPDTYSREAKVYIFENLISEK